MMRQFFLKQLSMAIFLSLLFAYALPAQAQQNPNALATGKYAKTRSTVNVAINPVANLNWKTKGEILSWRLRELQKYPQLVGGAYTPYTPIWILMEDKKPWWGVAGSCVWGKGQQSIEGPAEESRFILNPLLLVAADPATLLIWNRKQITAKDVCNPNFPFLWQPESLRYDPVHAMATAVYNVSNFQKNLLAHPALKMPMMIQNFSLVAYNARDFGYNYIYLDESKSINVRNDNPTQNAVCIRQMIHCGGTCGYPGGCNNMSPFTPEIDRCRFMSLPARAYILLWRQAPAAVTAPPDMTFLLEFH